LKDNRGFADPAPDPKPAEGKEGSDPKPDPEKFVPKEEHSAAIKVKEDELASIKEEVDKQKLQLLSKDYLDYLEDKKEKKPAVKKADPAKPDEVVASLQEEVESLKQGVKDAQNVNSQILADRELSAARSKYEDFADYEKDIGKFYDTTKSDVPFEQAYLLVKAYRAEEDAKGEDPKKPAPTKKPFASEKPTSTVPGDTLEQKDYETVPEANAATIATLREKYPDLGTEL